MSYSPYNLDAAAGGQKSETKRVILIVIASMLGFVLLAAFLVLTLKLPTVLSRRRAANEAAALSTIHNIATAEATYRGVHGGYGSGEALAAGGFIDAGFAGGPLEKNGYVFKLAVTPETEYVRSRYVITASPVTSTGIQATGTRHFYYDSTDGDIHVNETRPATTDDPILY